MLPRMSVSFMGGLHPDLDDSGVVLAVDARQLRRVIVESGCLALVMAHEAGKVGAASVKKAIDDPSSIVKVSGGNLLAMPKGTYVAFYDKLEKETDDGFFQGRLRLVRT